MARTKAKTTVKKKSSTSTIVKRARGNARSSKQGTDNLTFSLSFNQGVSVGSRAVGEDIIGVVPINVYDVMSQSKNYQALASIFEQVRIDYVAAVITVSTAEGLSANPDNALTNYSSYDLYTAWDRNGVDNSELKPIYINTESDISAVYPNICGSLQCITGSAISSYGSVKKSSLNVYQKWRHATWIAPKDLQEKQQFVNCKSIQAWHGPYTGGSSTTPYAYPIAYTDAEDHKTYFYNPDNKFIVPRNIVLGDQNGYAEVANNSDNPSLIGNSAKYPFKPTLLIGAFRTGLNAVNAVDNFQPLGNSAILLNIEWKIVVTFRGIKGIQTIK